METHSEAGAGIQPGAAIQDAAAPGPVPPAERIVTLDVLRGFALFGILFVNVHAMVHPGAWFEVAWSELPPGDYAFEAFKILFTQGKFYTLFAFLFGLGFAVQLDRAEQRANAAATAEQLDDGKVSPRMLFLFFTSLLVSIPLLLVGTGMLLGGEEGQPGVAVAGSGLASLFLFGGLSLLLPKTFLKRSKMKWRFAGRFFWRLVLLWLIGVTHMIVIWDGDILNTYAVGGVFLLLFFGIKRLLDVIVRKFSRKRDKSPRWLTLVAAGILMFGPFVAFSGFIANAMAVQEKAEAGMELTESEQEMWEQIQQADDPKRAAEREERQAQRTETYRSGSYADTVQLRIEGFGNRALSGPFWLIVAGIFMVGAYFGRNNFIGRAGELKSGFKKLMWTSLLLGLPLTSAFLYVHIAGEGAPNFSWFGFFNFVTKTASGLAFALFYVAAITLAMLTPAQRWLKWFAPVGRMALSNYLLQSVIGTFVFYGWGLGMMEVAGNVFEVAYLLAIFGLQILLSTWWLERFRFGPAEWLWRSLTYWKIQPMRKQLAAVAA